jgi:hypothetical protein
MSIHRAFTCVNCGREITEGMLCMDCSSLRTMIATDEVEPEIVKNEVGKLILCLSLLLVVCATVVFGVFRSKAPQEQPPASNPSESNWNPDPQGTLLAPIPPATLGGGSTEPTGPPVQTNRPPPYVAPNECLFCEGKGQIESECEVCNGSGEAECSTCTTLRRYTPRGGFSDNFESLHRRCNTCQGTSHPEEDVMGKTHYIFHCLKCNGTGRSKGTCPICKGSGKDH